MSSCLRVACLARAAWSSCRGSLLAGCGEQRRRSHRRRLLGDGRRRRAGPALVAAFERANPGRRRSAAANSLDGRPRKTADRVCGRHAAGRVPVGKHVDRGVRGAGGAGRSDRPRRAQREAVDPADYFPGVWAGNVIDERVFGVPWYVDTRIMFYRKDLLAAAGHDEPPTLGTSGCA